jgi:hypothetical protein
MALAACAYQNASSGFGFGQPAGEGQATNFRAQARVKANRHTLVVNSSPGRRGAPLPHRLRPAGPGPGAGLPRPPGPRSLLEVLSGLTGLTAIRRFLRQLADFGC